MSWFRTGGVRTRMPFDHMAARVTSEIRHLARRPLGTPTAIPPGMDTDTKMIKMYRKLSRAVARADGLAAHNAAAQKRDAYLARMWAAGLVVRDGEWVRAQASVEV